ncbi:MAG: DUF1801 domain-containing protein [Fuerstiella sp.]
MPFKPGGPGVAKKKTTKKSTTPRSFSGVIKGRSREVRTLATALRELVLETIPDAEESLYGGQKPMCMYRTIADICWIQPLKERCNVYFMRGADLTDDAEILEGSSDRIRHVKLKTIESITDLPLQDFILETVELNEVAISHGLTVDEVLERLRGICLSLPKTKETLTWGKPHFRVGEKSSVVARKKRCTESRAETATCRIEAHDEGTGN